METNEPLVMALTEQPFGFLVTIAMEERTEQYFIGLTPTTAAALALALLARPKSGRYLHRTGGRLEYHYSDAAGVGDTRRDKRLCWC